MLPLRPVNRCLTHVPAAAAVDALKQTGALSKISVVVITELETKAVGTLQQVLQACVDARTRPLEVVLSNPALQVLQSTLGEGAGAAAAAAAAAATAAAAAGCCQC
jgi:hypothetical protein